MRDALGGTVNIVIIVVFIVIVLGYLAFNVNYTKAFRMKNKIISTYENFHGCTGECQNIIKDYADKIGYKPDIERCPDNLNAVPLGSGSTYFCQAVFKVNKNVNEDDVILPDEGKKVYYKIATKISADIPIIKSFVGDLRVFWTFGDTKAFEEE